MRLMSLLSLSTTVVLFVGVGCGTTKEVQQERKTETIEGGLPKWITQCGTGLPKGTMCASGESDLAVADVEAAKTDAEISAKNRLADQLKARVGRLQERLVDVMKDLSRGKVVGERTLKDINQNFVDQELIGLRYVEYFYYPNAAEPKKIFVLATLDADDAEASQKIVDTMMQAAITEKLEMKHEEAQARFDVVRKKYLEEESAKSGGAAPPTASAEK